MKIRHKMLLTLGLVLVMYIFTVVSVFRAMETTSTRLDAVHGMAKDVFEVDVELLKSVQDMKFDVIQVQQWLTDISATRGLDGLNDGFDKAEEFAKKFVEDSNASMKMAQKVSPELADLIRKAQQEFIPYYTMGKKMASYYVAQGPEAGNRMMGEFDAAAETITGTMNQLDALIEKNELDKAEGIKSEVEHIGKVNFSLERNILIQAAICLLLTLGLAWYLFHLISRNMRDFQHDLTASVDRREGTQYRVDAYRKDEFGELSRVLAQFRHNLDEAEANARRLEAEKHAAEEAKHASMQKLADEFEGSVKHVVDMVAAAATEMDATAKSVSTLSDQSVQKLSGLNSDIETASHNVHTVASAAEELSSSVTDISQQVARAATITSNAVEKAGVADRTVQSLAEAGKKIGEVVNLINDIAAQINLLALNATIEAARAGEAGKGFAVVASEVKSLANQTTKATEEISSHIGSIQTTTINTVEVINDVSATVREINAIASNVAAAVEEQGAATQEIARSIQQVASGTSQVAANVGSVTEAAKQSGHSASEMLGAATELARQSEQLRTQVEKFVVQVRTGQTG